MSQMVEAISDATLQPHTVIAQYPKIHAKPEAVEGPHLDTRKTVNNDVQRWMHLFNSFAFPKHFYLG